MPSTRGATFATPHWVINRILRHGTCDGPLTLVACTTRLANYHLLMIGVPDRSHRGKTFLVKFPNLPGRQLHLRVTVR